MTKKQSIIFNTFVTLIFLGVFFSSGSYLFAQNSSLADTIRITPSIIEPTKPIEPGEVHSFEVKVTNLSNGTETFYPVVENMSGVNDQGAPSFTAEGTGYGLLDWILIDQESLTLESGESGDFTFTMFVPEDAGPQGYYGAFFVIRQAPEQRQTGAAVDFKVGTILNFRIQGDAYEEAFIREFAVGKNIYSNKEKVEFKIVVENLGNVLARPRGTINLVNMFGDQIAQIPVNHPRPGGVFPGTSRVFNVEWESEGFNFGRINAELDLTYGETGVRTISDKISFWVLPIMAMLGVALGVITFIVIVFVLVRMYINRQIKAVTGGKKLATHATIKAYSKPISKLTVITIAAILFTILFTGVVFFLFS
jgi:hypothetical protein